MYLVVFVQADVGWKRVSINLGFVKHSIEVQEFVQVECHQAELVQGLVG